jgi:hypothetical protein
MAYILQEEDEEEEEVEEKVKRKKMKGKSWALCRVHAYF